MKILCTGCGEIAEASIVLDLSVIIDQRKPRDIPKVSTVMTISCKSCGATVLMEDGITVSEEVSYD